MPAAAVQVLDHAALADAVLCAQQLRLQAQLLMLREGAAPCRFYFAYCEAAFDARYLHNFQILWEKSSEPDAAATSHAPMSPSEMHKQAVPPLQSAPSDPTTQVSGWECAPSPCGTSCLGMH